MKKMKLRERNCQECGATFTTRSFNKFLCDACQRKRNKKKNQEYYERKRHRNADKHRNPRLPKLVQVEGKRRPHPNDNILELVRQADKLGMSYGYYIAKLYDEERRKK